MMFTRIRKTLTATLAGYAMRGRLVYRSLFVHYRYIDRGYIIIVNDMFLTNIIVTKILG